MKEKESYYQEEGLCIRLNIQLFLHKEIDLNNSGQEYLYVGELSKGIYFGALIKNEKLISTKKLVVK